MYKIEFLPEKVTEDIAPGHRMPGRWMRHLPISNQVYERYNLVNTLLPLEENAWAVSDHAYLVEEANRDEERNSVDRRLIKKLHWNKDIRDDFSKDLLVALGYYFNCENKFCELYRKLKRSEISDSTFMDESAKCMPYEKSRFLDNFRGSLEPLMSEYLFSSLIGSFDGMDAALNAIYDLFSDVKMMYEGQLEG